MGIEKSCIEPYSKSIFVNAYHKIYEVIVTRMNTENSVKFRINSYSSKQVRDDKMPPFKCTTITCTDQSFIGIDILDHANIFTKCYDYLKTQSNADGIDFTTGTTDVI